MAKSQIKNSPPTAAASPATAVADPPDGAAVAESPAATPAAVLAVARRERELSEGAEVIFKALAAGREVSADERALLRSLGPIVIERRPSTQRDYDRWLRFEVARLQKVAKLQSRCGTAKDRNAAGEGAEKAEAGRDCRGPEIDVEITRLRSEKTQLLQAAEQARAASDDRQQALRELRRKDTLPLHIRDDLRAAENRWSSGDGHRLESARQRLVVLAGLSALDVSERKMVPGDYSGGKDLETVKGYIENCPDLGPDPHSRLRVFGMLRIIERPPHGTITEVIPDNLNRAKWRQYLDSEVAPEIETLRKQITALEVEETKHHAALATSTNHYVPR